MTFQVVLAATQTLPSIVAPATFCASFSLLLLPLKGLNIIYKSLWLCCSGSLGQPWTAGMLAYRRVPPAVFCQGTPLCTWVERALPSSKASLFCQSWSVLSHMVQVAIHLGYVTKVKWLKKHGKTPYRKYALGQIQVLRKGGSASDRPRQELLEGVGGMLPREILKFIPSEMRFPAFWGLI